MTLRIEGEKAYVVYRYAKPSQHFKPTPSREIENMSYIYAGLDKHMWDMLEGNGIVLHKIELTQTQASKCLVAETCYDWDEDWEGLSRRDYLDSLVSLTKYKDNYNKPEVLIPFVVSATMIGEEK